MSRTLGGMKKPKPKRIKLESETLRTLAVRELTAIVGGGDTQTCTHCSDSNFGR